MEASAKQNIILSWLIWHFFETPKGILNAFKNFLILIISRFLFISKLFSLTGEDIKNFMGKA